MTETVILPTITLDEDAPAFPWHDTREALPERGVLVEAADSARHVQPLRYKDGLWWFDDYSLYVYYTPAQWRYRI